ncbi:MAG: ABC transporter permease [Terrimicrobiaceae bacterium]|nr:ABC transporter permease [Terrimicrobiaceae bacterium]
MDSTSPKTVRPEDFDLWIEAGHTEKHYWADLWRFRELLVMLAWRDIAVRYKQTVAGFSWAILQPFVTMVIMTIVFGRVAGLQSIGNAPYAIMVFAAMLPWQFFANALTNSGQSIVANSNMISKVYFPRVMIPGASVIVSLVDFLVSFAILAALMVWYQFWPTWRLLTVPFFAVLAMAAALGPGLLVTALTVRYRDFRFITPFVIQLGLFVSPVAYSSEVIREKLGRVFAYFYSLNPLVVVIDGFRWAILGSDVNLFTVHNAISFGMGILILIFGISYFRRTERSFADVI